MDERPKETAQDAPYGELNTPPSPTAYIPACGTLCDAFWWARPSQPPRLEE
jgi:hypothetical protein